MKFSKKSLGQNFLIDKNIIKKIINLTKIKSRNIIEIGPGTGALTDEILKNKPKNFYLIEKDNNLAEKLKNKYKKNKTVKIYNADILRFDLKKIIKKDTAIFGNLPYNISSQILIKLIKLKNNPVKLKDSIFMFQKELGNKILGKFPSKNYGRLSIFTNYKTKILRKFAVSSNCFFPKPKVESMVIHFEFKKNLFKIKDMENLEKITNILFSNKRKMINKNIKKILSDKNIKRLKDLKLNMRPSDIKPEIYYKITELYEGK